MLVFVPFIEQNEIMTVSKWSILNLSIKSPWRQYTDTNTLQHQIGCDSPKKNMDKKTWWFNNPVSRHLMVWVFVKPGRDQKSKDKEIRLRSFGVHVSMLSRSFISFVLPFIYWCVTVLLLLHCVLAISLQNFIANEWCH